MKQLNNLKTYEQFNNDDVIFYIDVRGCDEKDRMKLLKHIQEQVSVYFNGANNIDNFVKIKDSSGFAWALEITYSINYITISGIHTIGWNESEIKTKMFTCEESFNLDFSNIPNLMKILNIRKNEKEFNI